MRLHWKRMIIVMLLLAIVGLGVLSTLNWWVIHQAEPWMLSTEDAAELEADCILVLGAGLWAPGQASPMLADRLSRAMELWELHAGQALLMSGDHGTADYNEVTVMRDWALDAGVEPASIFMDHAGFSTYESMVRARDVFQCQKIVIVTQEYHLYRAVYIARRLGLDAYGVAAENVNYANQSWRDAREVLARVKDVFYGLFQPDPTFLGEAIAISGDGTASWDDAEQVIHVS